jgi:predicted nucleic acid-binding protein
MMLLLDTNVLSELMRPNPNEGVVHWLDAQRMMNVRISAVTVVKFGWVLNFSTMRRRNKSNKIADQMFKQNFRRCLPLILKLLVNKQKLSIAKKHKGKPITVGCTDCSNCP